MRRLIHLPFKPITGTRLARSLQAGLFGLLLGVGILIMWSGGLFAQTRLRLNDLYYVPVATSGQVVIIAIDNASLTAYGRTPSEWSRVLFADLLDILANAGARAVGFDILFSEPTPDDDALQNAIAHARQSEARTRVVMPAVGLSVADEVASAQTVYYADILRPHNNFYLAIDNIGFVNVYPDADNTIRRQLSSIHYATPDGTQTGYSFAIALYLAYLRIPTPAIPQVITTDGDKLFITPDRTLRVDSNGLWMPKYFDVPATSDHSAFTVISFVDVLEGRINPAIFADKAVLVGVMNSTGITDLYTVPTSIDGSRMAGVEIHAHAFESIFRNVSLREQSALSQALMLVGLAIFATVVYSHLNWWAIIITCGLFVFGFGTAVITYFDTNLVMLNVLYGILTLAVPVIFNQIWDLIAESITLQRTQARLQAEQEISDLRLRLIEEKDQQNATLSELSALKTRMIRMASHDLKNPLGIIITYGSLIVEDTTADPAVMREDHTRFVQSMVKAGDDMLKIIEEILNIEQLRSGNLRKDPVAFSFLVKEVVDRHLLDAQEKKQTLSLVSPPDLPLVYGDYRQLFQAITNLVGNALKYTPDEGNIAVRLSAIDKTVRFEVEDNGYGISEEGQQNLFREFYRVRSAATAHIQGTGLGLSLVKVIIEAHGGKIWVKSVEGAGSTFYVELPMFEGTLDDE